MAGERNGPGWGSVGVAVRPSFGGSLASEAHKPCRPELLSGSRLIQQRLVCVEAGQTFSIQRVKVLTPQLSSIHCRLTRGRSLVRSQSGPQVQRLFLKFGVMPMFPPTRGGSRRLATIERVEDDQCSGSRNPELGDESCGASHHPPKSRCGITSVVAARKAPAAKAKAPREDVGSEEGQGLHRPVGDEEACHEDARRDEARHEEVNRDEARR